jgi:hypothetical protein
MSNAVLYVGLDSGAARCRSFTYRTTPQAWRIGAEFQRLRRSPHTSIFRSVQIRISGFDPFLPFKVGLVNEP